MKPKEIKLVSEILVKHVKDIQENDNGLQQMFLQPYINIVKDINNFSLAKSYLDARMHAICFAIVEKIALDKDKPIQDEVDARGRLQQIYDLCGTCVDEFRKEFIADDTREKEHMDMLNNINSQMVKEDLETLTKAMKDVVSEITRIVAINMNEELLKEMEKAKDGSVEDKKEFLEKVFAKGI